MKTIGTLVDDSRQQLLAQIDAQQQRPGLGLDAYFYRSHLVYQQELSALVFKSWLYAAHSSEIANPGDFIQFEVGEDAVIISRTDDGEIHAFMNICRHRGSRVCEPLQGSSKTFVCPYHGWVYNLDGSLRAAREMEALSGFDPSEYRLRPVKTEVFMGLIFVNCDEHADDFRGPLENIRIQLGAYGLENARVAHKETYQIGANWKLCLENYQECYHCSNAHRRYARLHSMREPDEHVSDLKARVYASAEERTGISGITNYHRRVYGNAEGFGNCVYTSRYALYDGNVTGSEDGQPVAPLMGQFKDYDGGYGDFQLGPMGAMLNYPDHCVLYRFIPRGLTSTDMQLVWFVRDDAVEGVDYDRDKLISLWHHTSQEDEYIITRNSEGVNSHFFEPGPYHPGFEETVMSFIDWYLNTLKRATL